MSVAYTAYLISTRPYADAKNNFYESFNEVMIIIISCMYFIFLTDNERISEYSKLQSGWLFLGLYMTSFGFNFLKMSKVTMYERVPESY